MTTREETAQVTFNNNLSNIRLAQLNTIQHRAREGSSLKHSMVQNVTARICKTPQHSLKN